MNSPRIEGQTAASLPIPVGEYRTIYIQLLAGILALLAVLFFAGPALAHEAATPSTTHDVLALDGLLNDPDACPGGYRIAGTELCSHGPDAPPPGFDPNTPVAETVQASAILCEGDGVSGKRVQIMYVRAEDTPDRYQAHLASFRQWAWEMDEIFEQSARKTDGHRRIRFVTEPDCQLSVLNVVVESGATASFQRTIAALGKQGYNSKDRKYVAFVDANVYCGIGTIARDPDPSLENRLNHRADYARIDASCWSGFVAAHELTHNMGGVQPDAPNASGGWHCVDEFDLMCYSDAPLYPAVQVRCPVSQSYLLDCNDDDYFHSNPPAGSYLATHWNVANSLFLIARDWSQNKRPGVAIVTGSGTDELQAPASITVTAHVSDSDGIVTLVEFYNDETLLKSMNTGPYTLQWEEIASGTYNITAKVYDDFHESTTSEPLTIQVLKPPTRPSDQVYLPLIVSH